ncbi:hypothetical protein Cgig2_032485 [Carnegiea gigantea]|uniref:Protein kinase domain-containing protein n=1 Tax=Carnegiea gigantea TaxID=171969 RepID=A0A9Q1KVW9_9CARY|nr:hypothetical protein Cgig2_032485 [Carnegiea gigantea]
MTKANAGCNNELSGIIPSSIGKLQNLGYVMKRNSTDCPVLALKQFRRPDTIVFRKFYVPREYGLGNELSTDGDVYSFGILLLEIFTGKRPTDDMFKEGMSLQSFVQAAWPERVMEILDHVLLEDIIGEATNRSTDHTHHLLRTGKSKVILEALTAVLGIALSCSAELPQDRLDMSDVAAKLSSIRNKLHGVRSLRQRQIPAGKYFT